MRSLVKAFVLISVLSLAASDRASAGPLGGPSDGTDGSVNQTSSAPNLPDPAVNATPAGITSDSNTGNLSNKTMYNSTGASTTLNTTDSGNATLLSSDAAPASNVTSSTDDSFGALASLGATDAPISNSTYANSTFTNSSSITAGVSNSTAFDGTASIDGAHNASATSLTDDASSNNTTGLSNETSTSVSDASAVSNTTDDASGLKDSFAVDNSTSFLTASPSANATISLNSTTVGANSTTFNITSNSTQSYSGAVGSVRTFVLSQNISWTEKDFNIYDNGGPLAYVISKAEGTNTTSEDIVFKVGSTGEKKLQVDAYPGKCGKETDWLADDGTKITLDPRGLLPDRWYIKNPEFPKPQYTFMRDIFDLGGDIVESNSSRLVGSITKQKLKSALPNLPFTTGDKVFVVTNNGFIPDWDLLTMLALAVQHHRKCFY